ncbi:Endonuclease, Uma2 family (restriction endonuclease fold) [Desulfacinum infernum DSM 9756]|uniref:Endonuclease, Uma2 family (Restriction endonuclease fold) n=1 Tax=Desulfacinum infernum DSM 9756 TaxID=1121391 RepID=A0A1M5DZ78_9BACT|nr:Uma2 family endonuclease [Desulfacinum infernum]SHF72250.1 Endonuclease, Uma2 family (restriction endonuclease fold) [Desulfacinum infernum DSM 9756]
MWEPAKRRAVYEDLYDLPENVVGEIIGGELVTAPRPSRKHAVAASRMGYEIGPTFDFGRGGGPGGWVIILEPEVAFGENILVPDLAGWKKERFPTDEPHNWISVAPDWICEVLSPATARRDRADKMPIYARHEVRHLWLLDPDLQTLEVFVLEAGRWVLAGVHAGSAKVRAEPFQQLELDLGVLWLE